MNDLNPELIERRKLLTQKLKMHDIDKSEATELKNILEKEKTTALSLGDWIAILGIGLLLALVIDYLTKDDNESL